MNADRKEELTRLARLSEQAVDLCDRLFDAGTEAAEAKDASRFERILRVAERADDRAIRRITASRAAFTAEYGVYRIGW